MNQATANSNKLSNFTKKYGIVLILVLLVAVASDVFRRVKVH